MNIEVSRLGKQYNGRYVLRGIDLRVDSGQFVLVCGANGAGKSTLLRLLATLVPPTTGQLLYDGRPWDEWGPGLRERIGVLFHESLLYDELSAEENLLWVARLYGVPDPRERVAQALEQVGLRAFRRELTGRFSRGMKQRLSLARCLLVDPPLLLLDEPYEGLDHRGVERLHRWLSHCKDRGKTVLLVAHQWEMAWSLADRLLLLRAGRLVEDRRREQTAIEQWRELVEASAGMGAGVR